MLKKKLRRWLTWWKAIQHLQMCGYCLVRPSKTTGRTRKQTEQFLGPRHYADLATIPSIFLRVGSAPLHVFMGSRPHYWRNELLYRAGDIERHSGPKRARPLRGRDVPMQDILPTTAQHFDVAVSKLDKYLRVGKIRGPEKLVSHGSTNIRNRRFVRTETVRGVLAATLSKRVYCMPLPASNTDCVAGMASERYSLSQFTSSREEIRSAKCGLLSKLTAKPCSAGHGNIKWMGARQVRILQIMNTLHLQPKTSCTRTHILLQLGTTSMSADPGCTRLTLLSLHCLGASGRGQTPTMVRRANF